jgi:hypothetical protein
MKTLNVLSILSAAVVCAFTGSAFAGTFKHITVDGSFADWTGVPLAYTQAQDVSNVVAYQDIYIANDENYLYVRFSIYNEGSSSNNTVFTSQQNYFFNTDNAPTGYTSHGVGSEMLIQGGNGYQQKNGGFNEGAVTNVNWAGLPAGVGTNFEFRVSRNARYASDGTLVFANDTIALTLESETAAFAATEWFPPSGGGVAYTFELPPTDLTTNLTLIDLTNSSWQVNDSGTDLGTNWLDQAYDDISAPWIAGLGLFGYTPSPGAYPAIQTALSSSPTNYYFRTHFAWNNNSVNIAFVITNYLSDGAVYYLNGAEVKRIRMAAGNVAFNANATGTNSPAGRADVFGLSDGPLVIGDNILEVETHQAPSSGADMVFGLSLTAAVQFPIIIMNTNLPADVSVVGGQPATFTSDVFGSGPISYQWLKNGTNIAGATNSTFTIPVVVTNDVGGYSLRLVNSVSTNVTRTAQLTVLGVPVVFTDPTKPADQYVVQGRPVTFTVVASGSAVVQYQWYKGASPITDATNVSYTIAAVVPTNAGSYHVLVSNPVSATNSRNAILTVLLDTIAPAVTNVTATPRQIILTFSEAVDPASATNLANYALSGGTTLTNAVLSGKVVTLTTFSPLSLGTVYSLSINGVMDLFGNAAHATVSLSPTIVIDGDFSDWSGLTPIYSNPTPGSDGAADFKDIYVFNDANYYYLRATLYHDIPASDGPGCFPRRANQHYDTDNNGDTGYKPAPAQPGFGSEFLQQSGSFYQERGGTFSSEGQVLVGMAAGYLIRPTVRPASYPADFEWRFPRTATFSAASGGGLVFSTNVLKLFFQGQTPGFVVLNQAPAVGLTPNPYIPYTNVVSAVVPALAPGQLAITSLPGGNVALTWDPPGSLQVNNSLASSGTWTNLPAAVSPYVIPSSGAQQFFRLAK